ncbi:MAG TPA: hypothetical protein VFU49_06525 [Ktedonobacteraceae bacterium]|nr:hypothetical protein [Ktedonobacteraceae bacterium]
MATGVSRCYYPTQPDPRYPLVCDECYFLLKIHDTQAFFPANRWQQAQYLLFTSSVESSFFPGNPTQSLHKLTSLKTNVAAHLGVSTNLTGWLPAREQDTIKVTINYTVKRGAPVKELVEKMQQLHIESVVSLVRPDMAVAAKTSQIVAQVLGNLLSSFLQEDEQTEIFALEMNRNLSDLKAGYYAVLGAMTNERFPLALEMHNGQLIEPGRGELPRHSYVVIEVLTTPRHNQELIRCEPWGELLLECKEEILHATIRTEHERDEAFQQWRISLRQIRRLAQKDRSFLLREIDAVLAEAQMEIEQKLQPRVTQQAQGLEDYPDEWQEVLHFSTPQELRRAVRDHQDALELSEQLLRQYNLPELSS